ncbi:MULTISPECIES: GTPase Era [Terrabacteria group]|uniref:GTPase Era n=1 Tax=Bacillati TaxID=1783272 RepID=UPI00193AD09E|nr:MULTISPECIES: GTPase Era [Terrabacteria group]MBW9212385.1 GTPase Era [Trueperella sp. zg.1013]QRG86039.1 GTPase Era [Bulleidia sp. zg-1006]
MRSGFVGIAGRPNAGKSSLINALVAEKIAIVSKKSQTTRSEIRGILTREDGQIIFTDTPGIHKPFDRLGVRMNKEVYSVIQDVDMLYLVVDARVPFAKGDAFVLEHIANLKKPVFLILNKVDCLSKEKVMAILGEWSKRYPFAEYFPISAKFTLKLDDLIQTTLKYLPEGDYLYPSDITSDNALDFRLAEIVREKILCKTEDEVPHACAVYIEKREFKKNTCYIQATILVDRPSQKPILIGKEGSMLKKIGSLAREDMEILLGKKVFLELFVRVEEEWRSKDARISQMGYAGANRDE